MRLRRLSARLTAGLLLALLAGGLIAGPARVAAQRDNGLTGDTSYESPEFGYDVEWDDPWIAEEDDIKSTRDGDSLSLTSDGAYLAIFGFTYAGDPADAVAIILETIEESTGEIEIVDESGDDEMASAEVTFELEGIEAGEYVEARPIGGGATVVVTLTTPSDLYDEVLESANETIELDGDPIFATLGSSASDRGDDENDTRRKDEDEDDGRDSTRRDEEEDEDEDRQSRRASGVDGSAYVSPAYGYALDWDREWEYIDNVEVVTGDDDEPLASAGDGFAFGPYSLVYTDGADTMIQIAYVECRTVVEGEAVVSLVGSMPLDAFETEFESVLALSGALTVDAR